MLDQITRVLLDKLRINPHLLSSAVTIIKVGVEIVQGLPNAGTWEDRKALLLHALELVAAGADGVLGTQDDLIPSSIMQNLKILLETKMASDMIGLLQSVDLQDVKKTCKCLPF